MADEYSRVFGEGNNYSALPATMMNDSASGPMDWNAVMTAGIRGAALNAMSAMVGGAYADGQLVDYGGRRTTLPPQQQGMSGTTLLMLAAVGYMLFKDA